MFGAIAALSWKSRMQGRGAFFLLGLLGAGLSEARGCGETAGTDL